MNLGRLYLLVRHRGQRRQVQRDQLVLDHPGGFIADAQAAVYLQGGIAILVLRQLVDGQVPDRQPPFGVLEDRSGGQRSLVTATVASIALRGRQFAVRGATAMQTNEPAGPARPELRVATLLIGPVGFEECLQA